MSVLCIEVHPTKESLKLCACAQMLIPIRTSSIHMVRMQRFPTAATLLAVIFSPIFGQALSAGDCGPTSIANVPGCWGTPVSYGFVANFMNGIDND